METTSNRPVIEDGGIRHRVLQGLALLLEAHEFATELERDLWDFAVEARTLRSAGLTTSDLRWLNCKGFVTHKRECTRLGRNGREFRPAGDLTFTKRSCFVITDAGLATAIRLLPALQSAPDSTLQPDVRPAPFTGTGAAPATAQCCAVDAQRDAGAVNGHQQSVWQGPHWDGQRHELRVGERLVKVFKLPSPNQEAILMAFDEEGWPPRIDDPLPPVYGIDPKRRLHDTIKSLNRRQRYRCMKFMGDGTGEGVRWEFTSPPQTGQEHVSSRARAARQST